MVKVNEQFSYKRDHHGWQVIETVHGINRETKEPTINEKKTFHGTLEAALNKILINSTASCENVSQVLGALLRAKVEIKQALGVPHDDN